MDPKLHPAITVSNIKNFIPITLEVETSQYSSWAELFKIHCRAFQVLDHLSPRKNDPVTAAVSKDADKDKTTPDDDVWSRLDAIVLQWIYGTISTDLLSTIIRPDSTACYAWTALKSIFHDNQATQAVLLQKKFANVKLDSFPSMSAYCQEVKIISDQLANVGSPVTENTLVIQLLSGLNEAYGGISSIIANTKPTPTFYEARSQLVLEETTKANRVANETALHTTHAQTQTGTTPSPSPPSANPNSFRGRGRGRSRGRGRGRNTSFTNQQYPQWQSGHWPSPHYNPTSGPHTRSPSWPTPTPYFWAVPPCPYPSVPPSRPTTSSPQQGILGPRPQQAYATSESSYTPTELDQAFSTFSLQPPDHTWYMDTGATGTPHTEANPPM
ncbi:putative RNA-directed DNA polymerase [Helianthus annuus]|nr:putative RNA-directed DNA polymerase [Helianthus annuus]KAJ0932821.1 putative RNA-directed DNA polymerase [Helianthus annuus]